MIYPHFSWNLATLLSESGQNKWSFLVCTLCVCVSTSPQPKYRELYISGDRIVFIYFIELLLIYNFILISAVQQYDLVIHIHTFFFIFFSIMVYQKILNIVPCAIQ